MSHCRRVLSLVLITTQVLFAVPAELWADQVTSPGRREAPKVQVNRRVPAVTAPPARPVFSPIPTEAEILRARVFPEPLVPVGVSAPEDNVALAAALLGFVDRREPNTLGPVARFMETRPTSAWQPSLLLNAGLVFLQQGFFTRAAQDFRYAWTLAKDVETPGAKTVADAAIGELLSLEARLGHAERVEELLADLGTREVSGAATEKVSGARQSLFAMQQAPAEAFRCGPYALAQMLGALSGDPARYTKLMMTRTGPRGSSLAQLATWAKAAGVDVQTVQRTNALDMPVPSLVHFTAGHFAALVRRDGDRYLLRDPAVNGDQWVSGAALHEEGSGLVLVAGSSVPEGWRAVDADTAAGVWGKGYATGTDPGGPTDDDHQTPGPCDDGGMPVYRVHLMMASVHVTDAPFRYAPPVGPEVRLHIGYNQRESHQPQTFTYSNLGPKWTLDWLSYVVDDPANGSASVGVFRSGGGQDTFSGFDAGTGAFAQDTRSHATLRRLASSPVRYERSRPDGSLDVFTQADGASAYPRRVFLTERRDPQGHALTFTYDAQLRVIAVSDAAGQVTTLAYDLPQDIWKITRVTDPFGRSAVFTYTDAGYLRTTTDSLGLPSSFTYAADGFMTAMTTPYGTTRFTKSDTGNDRTVEVTDPLGAKERVEFHVQDTSIPTSDPAATVPTVAGWGFSNSYLQYRNTFYWDKRAMAVAPSDKSKAHLYHWLHVKGNVNQTVSILESEKAALEARVWYAYPNQATPYFEGDGRAPAVTARVLDDGTTQAFLTEYNSLGQPTKHTDPLGRATTFSYAANGLDLTQVKQTTGGLNDLLASFTYNSQHQPLTVTDAAGQTTTLTYNTAGQLLTATNARNETTTLAYNTSGQLLSANGPVTGATVGLTYDGYGRVRTTTNSDSYVVTNDYDAADRLTGVTFPDNTSRTFVYDRLDLTRERDRAGRWTTTTHDAARRPIATRDALGRVVRQAWCACGSLSNLTDPNGNVTAWDRDVVGRVTKETRANGSVATYAYETTTSRLKSTTDPKLQVTTYSYAKDNALTGVVYTNASIATPSVTFSYDANYGRVASMADGTGTTGYTYQSSGTAGAGQLATVDGPLTDDTITYAYDVLGRVSGRTLNTVTDTWTYDALGRVSAQGDPIGAFTYAYDGPTGRLQQLTYPNGQTSTYSYLNNAGDRQLQDIHHQAGTGTTLSRFSYTYTPSGNITTWTQQYGTDMKAYDFTYDAADQLTGAVYRTTGASPTIVKRYGYAYDPTGNRTTARTDDTPLLYAYNNMNRLTTQSGGGVVAFKGTTSEAASVTVAGKPAVGAATSAFAGSAVLASGTSTVAIAATDASGNTATQSYEVDVPTSSGTFTYDANGNLTAQGTKTYEWNAVNQLTRVLDNDTEIARFAYDGYGRRAQKITSATRSYVYDGDDIVQERTVAGTTRLIHGPGVDQPLASVDAGSVVSYYLADHLGSVVQQTNVSGTLTLVREYDPYGLSLQGAATSGYAFTGREWDAETGLYYYRARYYDPTLGRFLSPDPIGFAGGSNFYSYASGSPVQNIDPTGLDTYIVNRQLGGDESRSRWNPLTHTFVVTTTAQPNGSVTVDSTYSWGNKANTRGWNKNQPEDIASAKQALAKKGAQRFGDESLDKFVDEAFNDLNKPQNQHPNWVVISNCKAEADNLLKLAQDKRKISQVRK